GVKFVSTLLCNELAFVNLTNQPSDHQLIGTSNFSSHPSVTALSRAGGRATLLMPTSGSLEDRKDRPLDVTVDYPVRARPDTFNDLNHDFGFEPPEVRKAWNLVAAISGKKANAKPEDQLRAMVLAGSAALTDLYINNRLENRVFAVDAVKWLLGEESIAGETN